MFNAVASGYGYCKGIMVYFLVHYGFEVVIQIVLGNPHTLFQ